MSDGFITRREISGSSGGDKDYFDFKALVNDSITEVTANMLYGATSIGNNVFRGCSSLTSIEIPNSVTSIGYYAFRGCSSLTSIEIPNSVTSIGHDAFYQCSSLTSIEIPNSVTSIGYDAFASCSSLTSVTVKAITPPTLESDVFSGTHSSLVIYVPAESVEAYKAATNWSTYADKIQAIPSE